MGETGPAIETPLPEQALAALDVALITTGPDRRITAWSPGAERIFGFSESEAIGARADELPVVTPERAAAARQALKSAPRSWLEHDLPLLRRDGDSFPARVRLAMLRDDEGRITGSVAMVTDTSSPRASRVELTSASSHGPVAALGRLAITGIEREELLARAVATVRDCLGVELVAVFRVDPGTGEIRIEAGTGWDPGVGTETFSPDEPHLGALTTGRVPLVEVELPDTAEAGRGLLAAHGVGSGVGISVGRGDGEGPPAALAAFSRARRRFSRQDIDFLGAVASVLAAAADRARARELERRFERLSRIEAIGQLTGGIAHDFNNLLSVILNYVSFAREDSVGASDGDGVESLREIEVAARRAAELTQQLLVFSRQEVVESRPTDVGAALESLRGRLERTLEERIELVIEVADPLPAVDAGPGQLEQIVLSLALNARAAIEGRGLVSIRAEGVGGAGPGAWVQLEVTDDGEGMSREVIEKAFDPFFTTRPPGTGLGLATVHGVVSSLGGSVELRSEPGAGTTVDVLLPASAGAGGEPPTEHAAPEDIDAGAVGPGRNERLGAARILLVEDDPLVRRLAVRVLEAGGHDVLAAAEASEALRLAREGHSFELVLSDVSMPQMSGPELVGELRSLQPGVGVVFMSGYTGEATPAEALRSVEAAFVEKPFTPETLLAGVAQALGPS